jgi:hypothetical protein
MTLSFRLIAGASILALATAAPMAGSASAAQRVYYPSNAKAERIDPSQPLDRSEPSEPPYLAPKKAKSGEWRDLTTKLPFANGPWSSMLLTDRTVIMEDYCTSPRASPMRLPISNVMMRA